jgi:hypothetical protein
MEKERIRGRVENIRESGKQSSSLTEEMNLYPSIPARLFHE